MSVLSDTIVIDEILIIGPDIQFEQRKDSSNLNKILQNVQAYMGPAGEAQETASEGKKLEIKRFVLQDAHVGVEFGSNPISITLPTIELNNLGSDQGSTAKEVMSLVIKEVTTQIIAEISNNPEIILKGGGDLLKNVGGSGGNALKSLGGLFGGSKNKEEENKEDQ